jgi:hypothetical protein
VTDWDLLFWVTWLVFVSKFMDDAGTYIYVTASHACNNLSLEDHSNFGIW